MRLQHWHMKISQRRGRVDGWIKNATFLWGLMIIFDLTNEKEMEVRQNISFPIMKSARLFQKLQAFGYMTNGSYGRTERRLT